jgi:hypothetical protein
MRIEPPVISSSQPAITAGKTACERRGNATNTKAMMMMLKRFFSDGI